MACEPWAEQLDVYLDGELPRDQADALHQHMRQCAACAEESLRRLQQKRVIQAAGKKFVPDPAFRARVENSIAARRPSWWTMRWLPVLATAAAVLVGGVFLLTLHRERRDQQQLTSELVDQHVATLASSNPVDVVSSDRHTVKPWFEGKIPFTFNLPELQGSEFALVGGRVSYLSQSPGAELIFHVRQHRISVFIFQERGFTEVRDDEGLRTAASFGMRSWSQNGLRYFVIGDASDSDLDRLREMLKAAG